MNKISVYFWQCICYVISLTWKWQRAVQKLSTNTKYSTYWNTSRLVSQCNCYTYKCVNASNLKYPLTSFLSKAAYSASMLSASGSRENTIRDSRLRASSLWCCFSAQSHGVSLFSFSANKSPPCFTRSWKVKWQSKMLLISNSSNTLKKRHVN